MVLGPLLSLKHLDRLIGSLPGLLYPSLRLSTSCLDLSAIHGFGSFHHALKLLGTCCLGQGLTCSPFCLDLVDCEAGTAGALIGQKIVLNEFLVYLDLVALDSDALTPRSRLIITYALCGFANLGSLGIMIGGLIAMAPERRTDIVALGGRALLVGALASLLSAAVVGALSW